MSGAARCGGNACGSGLRHVFLVGLHQSGAGGFQFHPRLSVGRRANSASGAVVEERGRRAFHARGRPNRAGSGSGFIAAGIVEFFGGAGFGGLWIAFIGWFLLQAAGESYLEAGPLPASLATSR